MKILSKKMFKIKIKILCIIGIMLTLLFGCQLKQDDNKIPTNEEIESAYQRANAIFKMFWGTGLKVDVNDKYTSNDNYIYYAVKYENIKSLNDLHRYLEDIFSVPIIEELMNIGLSYRTRFIETNNKLYQNSYDCTLSVLYHDIIEKDSYIQKISDSKFIYSIDKMLYEEGNSSGDGKMYKFNYVYEKIGDKWLFTEFPAVKPFTEQNFDYSNFNNDYPIVTEISDNSIIQQMYDKALEANMWFSSYAGISKVYGYPVLIKDDTTYDRVYNNYFKTLKDMEKYLSTLFSKEIVASKISNKTFISIDGLLYSSQNAAGFNSLKVKDTYVEKINDNKYVYYVNLIETFPEDSDEGKKVYVNEYPYEYINDRWVFTDFPSYRHSKTE